ncbi:MAG: hypothetical protein ACE5I3_03855 [Phycisphaerae bacterium]
MLRNFVSASGVFGVACLLTLTAFADAPTSRPTTQPAQPIASGVQTETPATAHPKSLLDFETFSLELGFEGRVDQRKISFDTDERFRWRYRETERARGFEETVGLRADGALFDEGLMLFEVQGRWGLTQERFSESRPGPDRSQSPHGDLLEYDLSFTLLPHGTVSANAYAIRQDSRIPRAFQPSLDRTLERYGTDVFVNHRTFPMRFSFEHVWDELAGRTRALRDDEERGRDTFRYEGTWQLSEKHAFRLEYEYDDRRERYSGTRTRFDTTRNYLVLNHTLRFGDDGRSALQTLARFQDETGDLARDTAEVSTQLRLQHTDALSTNYRAQFLRESFQELVTRTWRGEVGSAHQLGDALTSSLQLYGLRQNADKNADFTEWGGVANVSFSRDNALGRFAANLSYNHVATDTRDGTRRGIVIGESVTMRDPLLTYLAHTDVDLITLVVTDANRTRTYLPVRDYIAARIGRYTALRRVPSGQIADRQTVLVSYTYRVFADYDISRDRIDFRAQQDFKFGLTPYYAMSLQDEDIDNPRFLPFRARSVNRHRIGATYRQKRWSLGLEYEFNDDAIDPYQALHFNGDVVMWQDARNQLDGKGTLSQFWFDGSDGLAARDTTLLDLGMSYRYLMARNLEANASAIYRYEDDSWYGITHAVDLTGALVWKLGYFSLRLEAEYDALDLPDSSDDGFAVWLKLTREIPLITRKRL